MSQVEVREKRPQAPTRESPSIVPGPAAPDVRNAPRYRRPLLLAAPLVAMVIAAALYFLGGRYVSEENSYVGASTVAIAPQVAGEVSAVAVTQNQHVDQSATLFTIDPEPYRIAVNAAVAQLGITKSQIASQVETYRSQNQQAQQAQANLNYAQEQLQRFESLIRSGSTTQAQLDAARRDAQVAAANLASAQAAAASALAQIGGDGDLPLEQRPQYLAAQANLETAGRNLRLTEVKAPFAGIVTNVNSIAVGAFLTAGQQAVSMVDTDQPWIDSNLRETDLTYVQQGQPATVTVDAYPNRTFRGVVATINPASGAVFALIPPQNATGNWVKVVQRIPVRIAVVREPNDPLLRNGMSATVTIDTGHRRTIAGLWQDIRAWF